MSDVKRWCYQDDCKIVQTGFHLEQYFVCKVCRLEVSEDLKTRIETCKPKEPTTEVPTDDDYDSPNLWGI
jgi:hypothetical protein